MLHLCVMRLINKQFEFIVHIAYQTKPIRLYSYVCANLPAAGAVSVFSYSRDAIFLVQVM